MLQTHEKEKLINTITYFTDNTKNCDKEKLYKLLYLLDFIHFSEVGRTVTNLEYYAYPTGPVPLALDLVINKYCTDQEIKV